MKQHIGFIQLHPSSLAASSKFLRGKEPNGDLIFHHYKGGEKHKFLIRDIISAGYPTLYRWHLPYLAVK